MRILQIQQLPIKSVITIALFMSIIMASGKSSASQTFRYIPLTISGGTEMEAMAIGGNDLIVGSAYLGGNTFRSAVLWNSYGNATALNGLGDASRAFGASSTGTVVGYGTAPSSALQAISWSGGIPAALPTLGGATSGAYSVNSSGLVVGFADLAGNNQQHAAMWINGVPQDLGTLGGNNSAAYSVNASGQTVGYSSTLMPNVQRATIWTSLGPNDLGTLGGASSFAFGINNQGQIVGWSYLSENSGISRAALWNQGQILNLGSLGGSQSFAVAINDSGTAVGASLLPGDAREHAVMYRGSQVIDLNYYLNAELSAQGWYLAQARDISDAGAVVGWSLNSITGEKQAFLLSPVPELATLNLLALGLIVLPFVVRIGTQKLQKTEA